MSIFSNLKDKVSQYIDVRVKLLKINFIGRTSGVLSYLMFGMIALFIFFCIVLFLGFGLTEMLVALELPKVAAFFITIGFYVVLLLLLFVCRKPITRFFASGIVRAMTEGDDNEKEED
jgi:hypothetical protein